MKNSVILPLYLILVGILYSSASAAASSECPVDDKWLSNPSLPSEVKQSGPDGSSTFCDFYQFANQAYLYLMSPGTVANQRKFQDPQSFPLLEYDSNGNPGNSCDDEVQGITLRTTLDKTHSTSTGQAGDGATIFDQNGNVVYYQVRFNRSLCNLTGSAVQMQKEGLINFPPGTTEIKLAWRILVMDEIASGAYITQKSTINGEEVTLGLVGMHISRATKNHPEFVWATYEHMNNSPDCTPPGVQTNTRWSFASPSCTAGLANSAAPGNSCQFNVAKSSPLSKSSPTNICRLHPFGTFSGDFMAGQNILDITQQNAGMLKLLSKKDAPKSMKILENYFNVGAIWLSDISQNSGGLGVPNERGSLRLANTTAETTFQDVQLNNSFASNCFGCHEFNGTANSPSNNITSQSLSHTFLEIKIGQGQTVDITAGKTISDNSAAAGICKSQDNGCASAASYLTWDGNWTNINSSAGSVCGCKLKQ